MKRYGWFLASAFLFVLVAGFSTSVCAQPAPATLSVRVFFGPKMNGEAIGPCSDIKIVVTPSIGTPIVQPATGPKSGAKGGQCTATFKNLIPGKPLKLEAKFADFDSMPDDTHGPPNGKWTNPLTLEAGRMVVKYVMIDGKP